MLIAGGGTGGHLMPALAIATALRRSHPDLEPVLVGAQRGVEARIFPTRDFRHHLLPAEPVYRRQWWRNLRWPFVAARLLRRASRLLDEERPAAVLGTGGYASAPIVWLAARRGIPTAIQEQNAFPGLATRRLSRRVRHVYLGLPEARARLRLGRSTQVFDTGNPITPPDLSRRGTARARLELSGSRPVLLVTGGSQGALAINQAVSDWLDTGGGRSIEFLWATGPASYQQFVRHHRPPAVRVIDFLDPMADGYAVADLVVARAGMMTGAELCAWGLPSILVPLPTAAADHQTHNAQALAQAGAACLLPQRELNGQSLAALVGELLGDSGRREAMADAARRRGRPRAADDIVSHLLTIFTTADSFATTERMIN